MPKLASYLFIFTLIFAGAACAGEAAPAKQDDRQTESAALPEASLKLSPALAAAVEGIRLEGAVRLTPGGPELVLNGAGVRSKFFTNVYVGALYLPEITKDRVAIFTDAGPKRISMHMLADEVTASELISSMHDALAANIPPLELALLERRIRDLNNMMSSLRLIKKGGVIHLDYIPGTGTRITVNGEQKLTIPGADFYRAMLHIWIGYTPVDGRLRDAMLGHR